MINNFKIATFIKAYFEFKNYNIFIPKFDIVPQSSLFTATTQGKRFLSDFGDILSVAIRIEKVANTDLQQYLDLNGQKVAFKQDVGDTITHEMNCKVSTPNFNGLSLFNTILFELESVQGSHEVIVAIDTETNERRQVINPRMIKKDGVRYVKTAIENGSIILRKYKG